MLPLPEATRTVRATFKTMTAACACVPHFTRARVTPVAIEVLDRNAIRAVETEFAFGIGEDAGALLLVSVDGGREEVERAARVVEEVVKRLAATMFFAPRRAKKRTSSGTCAALCRPR